MGGAFSGDVAVLLFLAGIVTIVLSVSLRAFLAAAIQVLLLVVMFNLDFAFVMATGVAVQAAVSALVLYKYIMAIEMNYRLVMEKTHQIPVKISGDGSRGSRFSFWNTK